MSAWIALEAIWLVPRLRRNAPTGLANARLATPDPDRNVGVKDRVP
jgi:hypothetical protein